MMQTPVVTKPALDPETTQPPTSQNSEITTTHSNTQHSNRRLKAFVDYLVVVPTLLLIWPLMLILIVAIRFDSTGPAFYRRRVLGKNGRVFHAYKFRTMYVNGDEILAQFPKLRLDLNMDYKLKCDPRVTRIGRLLRKYSMDELPQLFNILKQDMSTVGPRIITPEEIEKYGDCGDRLISVMPGLTGFWQVNGRSNTSYDKRIELDMTYIQTWSIWLDIKILFQTIPAVLKGDGAY